MRYTLLGNSGLRVSEVALGTMTFGTDWGWGASVGESAKQFELFAEAGGTLIDTANKYTNGTAESILGDLLATDRDHFVVGTKYSLNVRDGDLNAGGNHRKSLVQALEASPGLSPTSPTGWDSPPPSSHSPGYAPRAVSSRSSARGPPGNSPTTSPAWTSTCRLTRWPGSIRSATSPAASHTTSWPALTSSSVACPAS